MLLAVLACLVGASSAQAEGPRSRSIFGSGGTKQTAVVLQILALLTVLSLAPAMFIMVTSFTRMVIVLSFLRQALGTQQVPPNQVLISLALFLTMFVMARLAVCLQGCAPPVARGTNRLRRSMEQRVFNRFAPSC